MNTGWKTASAGFTAALIVTSGLLPGDVQAHTRWFAEGDLPPAQISEPTLLYLAVCGALVAAAVTVGFIFQRHGLFQLSFLRPRGSCEHAATVFTVVCGAFFLVAGTHEFLFSPNLSHEAGISTVLVGIEMLVGLAFLIGVAIRFFAVVLALTWLASIFDAGFLPALENLWVLSTAAFVAVMGNSRKRIFEIEVMNQWLHAFGNYGVSLLRIGTGIALLTLGFSEKILAPELGLNFLQQHAWNFMQALGLPYSDYLFVLSAGTVEILLGLVFVLGIVTRLNALVAAIIFTIPLFLLGPIELSGHLPHFAAVVMLLLYGNGGRLLVLQPSASNRWATCRGLRGGARLCQVDCLVPACAR